MIQKGDKVFYSDNCKIGTNYSNIAFQTIKRLGLYPVKYAGTDLNIRNSSLDREIRDDFYESKVLVLILNKNKEGKVTGTNWVIPELNNSFSNKVKCLIFTTFQLTEQEIGDLNLPTTPIVMEDEKHFETILEQNLKQLLEPS